MDTRIQSQHVKPSICDVINLICQAALQPLLWSEILSDIRILCGADQCTLFFYDALEPHRCLASAARADEEVLTHYLQNSIQQQATQINNQLKALPRRPSCYGSGHTPIRRRGIFRHRWQRLYANLLAEFEI